MQAGETCYLLTSREVLMPATIVGLTQRNGLEYIDVAAPGGKVYTANPAHVFDAPTGRVMLMHRRAEQLAQQGYEIRVRLNGTFRVYQPKKHGASGGWEVSRSRFGLQCNCPAHDKEGTCKHIMAVCALLIRRAAVKRAAGKTGIATRYENLANVIHHAH